MQYIVEGKEFGISYQELKGEYQSMCAMSDQEFMNNLPKAIHLACIICFFKEIPTNVCLADTGIIHLLTHLLHIPDENFEPLSEIRKLFEHNLKLV